MAYLSLYRKYRSQSFEEVSGQEHVIRTLQNAIRSERVAHAYLFCGPRGTGKTTTARLLAKALNCERAPTPEPCNTCPACVQITEGRYLDMKEIDAASNRGIDEIRELRDNVAYAPANGRFKVYVIDEAHQITGDAFNAFLKTLEEPPPHVVFVMATTEAHKIPATIVSRCQKFEFRRATMEQLRERIAYVAGQEGVMIEDNALTLIAREANGGWRDALSLLEQVLAFCEGTITAKDVYTVLGTVDADTLYQLAEHIRLADGAAAYQLLEELIAEGKDPRQLLKDATAHYRTLMLSAAGSPPPLDADQAARILDQSRAYGQHRIIGAIETLAQVDREARWSEQPRLLLELAVCRLMVPPAPVAEVRPAAESRPAAASGSAAASRPVSTGRSTPSTTPTRSSTPLSSPTSRPSPPTVRDSGAASPFYDEPAAATPPARSEPAAPAPSGVFGADPLPPPPLTVGDARMGDAGDDDFGDFFDSPPAAPAPANGSSSASVRQPTPPVAPVPPATSSTAPHTGGSSLNIEAVRSKWRLIGEELKRQRQMTISAALADTMPARFEHDELVIQFPSTTMAVMFTNRGKKFSDPLVEAILRITGIQCRVRAEADGKSDKGGSPTATKRPAAGSPVRSPSHSRTSSPAPAEAAASPPPVAAPAPPRQTSLPSMPSPRGNELIHDVIEVFEGQIIDPDEPELK